MTKISDEVSSLVEQIEALLDLNAKGAVSHPVPSLAVELLAKAAQSLRLQGGVRVKPLEWSLNTATTQAAESLAGWYHVERRWDLISDPVWYWYRSGERPLLCSSEVEAKAAAQADYERRILSSLEASPAPVSEEMVEASCPGCQGTGDQGGNPSYGVCDDCNGTGKVTQPLPAALAAKGGQ